jgi:hypothetical protein
MLHHAEVTVIRWFVGTFFLIAAAVQPAAAANASCPVTQPPVPAFQPPRDEAPKPSEAAREATEKRAFWYGTPQLWTLLRRDGTFGRRDKMVWWSAGYRGEQRPNLVVTINRPNSGVTTVVDAGATNAHFDDAWSMMTMFEFPEPGCWQVTGTYRGNRLTFVLDVP